MSGDFCKVYSVSTTTFSLSEVNTGVSVYQPMVRNMKRSHMHNDRCTMTVNSLYIEISFPIIQGVWNGRCILTLHSGVAICLECVYGSDSQKHPEISKSVCTVGIFT